MLPFSPSLGNPLAYCGFNCSASDPTLHKRMRTSSIEALVSDAARGFFFWALSGASTWRETDGPPSLSSLWMVRLPLACALAVALILAGGAIEYDAFATNSFLKFSVALIAMGLGIAWLYSTVREWRLR